MCDLETPQPHDFMNEKKFKILIAMERAYVRVAVLRYNAREDV